MSMNFFSKAGGNWTP